MGSSFKFDEGAFDDFFEKEIRPAMQAEANAGVQEILREVNASYEGRPVAEVVVEIDRRFIDLGIEPNVTAVKEAAQAISDGTLA